MTTRQLTVPGLGVELKDSQFMSAHEKRRVLRDWQLFLKSALGWEWFTEALYHHLTQHCSFIAHYDRVGFYSTYFQRGDDTVRFLSQFDQRQAKEDGIPASVEYGMTYWAKGEYEDINRAMIDIAGAHIPSLVQQATKTQMLSDLARAKKLADRWGWKLTDQ
jgi:hypothetical protein